jgi:hypothetical protein
MKNLFCVLLCAAVAPSEFIPVGVVTANPEPVCTPSALKGIVCKSLPKVSGEVDEVRKGLKKSGISAKSSTDEGCAARGDCNNEESLKGADTSTEIVGDGDGEESARKSGVNPVTPDDSTRQVPHTSDEVKPGDKLLNTNSSVHPDTPQAEDAGISNSSDLVTPSVPETEGTLSGLPSDEIKELDDTGEGVDDAEGSLGGITEKNSIPPTKEGLPRPPSPGVSGNVPEGGLHGDNDPTPSVPSSLPTGPPSGAHSGTGEPLVDRESRVRLCNRIREGYVELGFLDRTARSNYCTLGCDFIRHLQCLSETPSRPFFADLLEKLWKRMDGFDEDNFFSDEGQLIDARIWAIWMDSLRNSFMILFCVVPVFLNQCGLANRWTAGFSLLFLWAAEYLGFSSSAITMNNAAIVCLSAIHGVASTMMPIYMMMTFGSLFAAWTTYLTGAVMQVAATCAILVGYGWFIKEAFFTPGKGSNVGAAVIVLAQMFILTEQVEIANASLGLASYGSMLIEYVVGSFSPCGASSWYLINSYYMTQRLVSRTVADEFHLNHNVLVLLGVFFQCVMFVFSRASLGAYYLYTLRCRFEFNALALGLWTYLIDVTGPVTAAYRQAFFEMRDYRRMLYAGFGLSMLWIEFKSAYGFFLLRIVFTLLDRVFIHSVYGRMTHYLSDVDFGPSFPHEVAERIKSYVPDDEGCPALVKRTWSAEDKLYALERSIDKLVAIKEGGEEAVGVGLLLKGLESGKGMLYAAQEMFDGARQLRFRTQVVEDLVTPSPLAGTKSSSMPCSVPSKIDLKPIVQGELSMISHLVCLSRRSDCDDVPDGCNVVQHHIEKWKVDKETGSLSVSVRLEDWELGGPLIGVLRSGEVRFAGVVRRDGSRLGNTVSMVLFQRSEDDMDPDGNSTISSRGAAGRRTKLDQSGSDHSSSFSGPRYDAYREFMDALAANKKLMEELSEWPSHLSHSNFPDCDSRVNEIVEELKKKADKPPTIRGKEGNHDGFDDGGYDVGPGPGRTGRRKNWRRDRAAIKRGAEFGHKLRLLLARIYSDADANVIFDYVMEGHLLDAPGERKFITGCDAGVCNFDDALPSYAG